MLAGAGILSAADLADIERGMAILREDIRAGRFAWSVADEDVHFNLERRLTALVGDAGKRLHTARSRNDQVATDLRLWLRREIDALAPRLRRLRSALVDLAERHAATIMPGFTHLQVAQPVTFGHHLLAYEAMLARDSDRLADARRRLNRMPLGSAALAGTPFPIDRDRVARELGFDGPCTNSLDAVSDRDFAIEFAAFAATTMMHLSRFAEELVLWSNPRFGFVSIADRFCTGSSIMPQKKNPDVPELVRGKSARVFGHLAALLVLMKGQPLAYNKDNQEDKEPLFDTVDTLGDCVEIMADLVAHGLAPVPERMRAAALRRARDRDRPRRLPGAQGPPLPRRARGRRARRARGGDARRRPRPVAAGRAAALCAADRRRRVRRAHARRLGREPRPPGRDRAAPRARGARPRARARAASREAAGG